MFNAKSKKGAKTETIEWWKEQFNYTSPNRNFMVALRKAIDLLNTKYKFKIELETKKVRNRVTTITLLIKSTPNYKFKSKHHLKNGCKTDIISPSEDGNLSRIESPSSDEPKPPKELNHNQIKNLLELIDPETFKVKLDPRAIANLKIYKTLNYPDLLRLYKYLKNAKAI
jgi:hypothetical protein